LKLIGAGFEAHILGNRPFAFWKNDLTAEEKKTLNADVSKVRITKNRFFL
jgi:hypothetical protein